MPTEFRTELSGRKKTLVENGAGAVSRAEVALLQRKRSRP